MGNSVIFDVAVIGLGAVGSAALYQLSKSGNRILGLDRFDPPHDLGSSHGETRITRLAVGEGEDYVALAKRSHEIWRELETQTGAKILHSCGGILMDSGTDPWSKHGSEGFWERTVRFAKNQTVSHEILSVKELGSKLPAFQLPTSGKVYWEKEAGYLLPELAISTQLRLAESNGAQILRNSPVLAIEEEKEGFWISTQAGRYFSKKLLISAGGWIKDFLPEKESSPFKICRQVLHWLEIDPSFGNWKEYPVWMWGYGGKPEDFIYGFPSLDGRSVKMASESFVDSKHPEFLNRIVSTQEQKEFWEQKVKGRIAGLRPNFIKSKVCFYTVTEDARFVVKNWKNHPNSLLVSACSGHGFKHSAALGEKLAKQLLNTSANSVA